MKERNLGMQDLNVAAMNTIDFIALYKMYGITDLEILFLNKIHNFFYFELKNSHTWCHTSVFFMYKKP
jgi:hypothetical protein